MIKAYSSEDLLPEYVKFHDKVESLFKAHFSCEEADSIDERIIREIDNAVIIDRNTGLIKTPYGLIDRMKLSKGCKTALVANWIKKNNKTNYAVDVISCGYNALDVIYELLDNTDICIIQHHIPTHKCKWTGEIEYDGEFIGSPLDLMLHFMGMAERNNEE